MANQRQKNPRKKKQEAEERSRPATPAAPLARTTGCSGASRAASLPTSASARPWSGSPSSSPRSSGGRAARLSGAGRRAAGGRRDRQSRPGERLGPPGQGVAGLLPGRVWPWSPRPGWRCVSAWTTATGHGTVVAALVIALGVALVAVAFAESVRRRIVPWLLTARARARHSRRRGGDGGHPFLRVDRPAELQAERRGRSAGGWIRPRHRPADRRPARAALEEGPDDPRHGPPRNRSDDRLGSQERLRRRSRDRRRRAS